MEKIKIEDIMSVFWRLGEVRHDDVYIKKELMCKQLFEKTIWHGKDGRFFVLLPFRNTQKMG